MSLASGQQNKIIHHEVHIEKTYYRETPYILTKNAKYECRHLPPDYDDSMFDGKLFNAMGEFLDILG